MKFILTKDGGAFNPVRVDYFHVCFNNINRKYDVVAEFAQYTLAVADFSTEAEAKNYIAQIVADLNKPAARWIKTIEEGIINPAYITDFQIEKLEDGFGIIAYGKASNGEQCDYCVKWFETEDDAQKYLEKFIDNLNS